MRACGQAGRLRLPRRRRGRRGGCSAHSWASVRGGRLGDAGRLCRAVRDQGAPRCSHPL